MTASISNLADRRHVPTIAAEIRAALIGRVSRTVLAQAIARAERLQSHGIARFAILRRVVAWALAADTPDDAA